ncbi:hypothetical protein TSUD_112520, partial [Trifolium subterraneum]
MEHKGGDKVCVTGASGFLASWLIKRLLLSGYQVIGTVRDLGKKKKVEHLWKLEGATERLELVQADLMEENSFDNAIMGCKGVFHIASPVLKHISDDPKAEILEPAVQGTLNVLHSCKRNPDLVRVVLASSSSAIRAWYPMSKTMAEKAAWKYCKENGIDLVTILPAFIIGPNLPSDLCSTASDVLGLFK